jgi:DNA-binding transcriptional ArsR family regulator
MSGKKTPGSQVGRHAYEGLDRAIHEKARLGIMTCLLTHADGLTFNDIKELCALTDGNLSRHLKVLEDEKLVTVEKGYEGKKPKTLCRLSKEGRKRFLEYLEELEKVVKDASVEKVLKAEKAVKPGDSAWTTA